VISRGKSDEICGTLANSLGEDLIDDAAGSGVDAADGSALAADMVEENDPIPKHSQAVKALQFAFERPDVPFPFTIRRWKSAGTSASYFAN
jgi:hypothetical protein